MRFYARPTDPVREGGRDGAYRPASECAGAGGGTSTIAYPVTTVVPAANQLIVTSTGTVTDGYAEGALSERIAAYPDLDVLSCLGSSVAQQTSTLTVTIT